MKPLSLIIMGLPLLLFSCEPTGKISTSNVAFIYEEDGTAFYPEYFIFHETDTVSRLHFKFNTRQLLYSKKENENFFIANVAINYKIFDSYESTEILDSATVVIKDTNELNSKNDIIGHIDLHIPQDTYRLIEITASDMQRKQKVKSFIDVDKKDKNNRQYFIVRSKKGLPLFSPHINSKDSLHISYSDSNAQILCGRYYNREFKLPPPPFSIHHPKPFEYKEDSSFTLIHANDTPEFANFPQPGFYHFQTDTSGKKGLTLFNFGRHFPDVKTPEELIEPLRYITSRKEFNETITSNDKKQALDNFWLNNASSAERAKKLIRNYYNRVKKANKYFTSYMEGWKTDRGMIYIVFGPPDIIYRNTNTESWTYGEEKNYMSLDFTFVKVDNPFTDNDYMLNRSPIYKNNWYRAVDSWRQGRIYFNN